MEDLGIQVPTNGIIKAIRKTLNELKLDLVSRSGLVPRESYVGDSSTFDLIWSVTEQTYITDIINIIEGKVPSVEKTLQEFKDNFTNKFMTLFHEIVVRPSKFNWNWDQTSFV